jgi:hypothetical protein
MKKNIQPPQGKESKEAIQTALSPKKTLPYYRIHKSPKIK